MNRKSRSPTVTRPESKGRSQGAVNPLWLEELEPRLLLSADLAGGLAADGGWQVEDPPFRGAEVEFLNPAVEMSHYEAERGTDGLDPYSPPRSTPVLPPPLGGAAVEDVVRILRLGPAHGAAENAGHMAGETHATGPQGPSQQVPGPTAPIPPGQAGGPFHDGDPSDEPVTSGHGPKGGPVGAAADAPRHQAGDTPEPSKQSAFRLADQADAPLPGELAPADAPSPGPGTGPVDTPGHQWGFGGSPTPPGTEQPGQWANRPADSPQPGEGHPESGQSPGPQPLPVAGKGGPEHPAFEESNGDVFRPSSDLANDAAPEWAEALEPPESQRDTAGALGSTRLVQDHPITWPQGFDLPLPSAGDDTIWYPSPSEAPTAEPETRGEAAILQGDVSVAVFGTVGVGGLGLSTGAIRWVVRIWTLLGSMLSSIPLWRRAKAFPILRMGVGRYASPGRGRQAFGNGVRPETEEEIDLLFDTKKAP